MKDVFWTKGSLVATPTNTPTHTHTRRAKKIHTERKPSKDWNHEGHDDQNNVIFHLNKQCLIKKKHIMQVYWVLFSFLC